MNRRNLFLILSNIFTAVDQRLPAFLRGRFRQMYFRIGYKIRVRLFPEYGEHNQDIPSSVSTPKTFFWIPPAIPEWVIDEMRVLGKYIDPAIYPTDHFLAKCEYYSFPVIPKPGQIYSQLLSNAKSDNYTHCFAIPWLKKGGADYVALLHIQFAVAQTDSKVLVFLTEPGTSPWLDRLPKEVDVIDISKIVGELAHEELILVITRIIIQLDIKIMHIINSRHLWEVVCKYGLAVRQKTKIFASIYCDDYDGNGLPVGFAREYLPCSYKHLSKVFSDNEAFPLLLQQTYGYSPELFSVLKVPVKEAVTFSNSRLPKGKKVLWAGRLDRQKRPDILLNIARALPDTEFFVYGDSVLDAKNDTVVGLRNQENVHMKGEVDGVEALPFSEFSLYLYTSQWDGTPTLVIAASLSSIPIVASSVGGISDLITEERGFPVSNIEDISAYVLAIETVFSDQKAAELKAVCAKIYVQKNHSESTFYHSLEDVRHYLKG